MKAESVGAKLITPITSPQLGKSNKCEQKATTEKLKLIILHLALYRSINYTVIIKNINKNTNTNYAVKITNTNK